MILLVSTFTGIVFTGDSAELPEEMSSYDIWMDFKERDRDTDKDYVGSDAKRGPSFTYSDGPYPQINDDGTFATDSPDGDPSPDQLYDCYVSDIFKWGPNCLGSINYPYVDATGDYVVWQAHELYIGDRNGDGNLEWVVVFAFLPWMEDGIDNDGDGCIDENMDEQDGVPCDSLMDAAVVYETGGNPIAGGETGDLLLSIDLYSASPSLKLYRALVSSRFTAYVLRGPLYNPQTAGDFISYYANEAENWVNANPEMDRDFSDFYVGNIDARNFPATNPVNHVCSAGMMDGRFSTWKRSDGLVITTYELVESYDNRDWNGDGDKEDNVVAYYLVDELTGDCQEGVNTGIFGQDPMTSGTIILTDYTWESSDGRDWTRDGDKADSVQLWHDVDSSLHLKGKIYRSVTYGAIIHFFEFGFGYWGLARGLSRPLMDGDSPFEFGGTYGTYDYPEGYLVHFWLVSDEDGDPQTPLPVHTISYGHPLGIAGGVCIVAYLREYYLEYAGVDLIGDIADANGDGDYYDTVFYIYCPEKSGGGGAYVIEETSRFKNGEYTTPMPFLWEGFGFHDMWISVNGSVTVPSLSYERCKYEFCGVDWRAGGYCLQAYKLQVA